MAVTCQTPGWRPPGAFFARCGRWPAIPRFLPDARQFVSCCRGAVAISFSRVRPQASMVAQALRRFASAKFGLRAIAHAAARELGPLNIHVAHLVMDSSVDTEWVRQLIAQREGQQAIDNLDPNRLMRPSAVAEAYWQLYQQPREAWTFEHEMRPFGEKF
jgi:NAD(P)-dependent dehydrogenase (short-subunit alcohol dehydrogenase family)